MAEFVTDNTESPEISSKVLADGVASRVRLLIDPCKANAPLICVSELISRKDGPVRAARTFEREGEVEILEAFKYPIIKKLVIINDKDTKERIAVKYLAKKNFFKGRDIGF